MCFATRQFEFTELLANAHRDEVEVSKDLFEPLNHILDLPNPMDAIADKILMDSHSPKSFQEFLWSGWRPSL